MDISDLRIAQATRPFQPYQFETKSGKTHHVRHPELLAIDADLGLAILTRGEEGLAILKIVNISEIVYSEAPVAEDD
jgi:hypothetical protein